MDTTERARLRARAMGAGAVAVVSSDLIAILDALDAAERAERERDEAVAMLREILARVHRDGGQRADAVGLAQATREADEIIVRDRVERDEARAEVERLRAELAEMRADRDAYKGALTRAHDLRIGDRAEARLDEREACAAVADEYAVDARAIAARCDGRFPATAESARIRAEAAEILAAAIRARGEGGAR